MPASLRWLRRSTDCESSWRSCRRKLWGQSAADQHAALVRYCKLIARGLERLDDQGRRTLIQQMVPQIVVRDGAIEIPHIRIADVPPPTPTTGRRGKLTTTAEDSEQCSALPIRLLTSVEGGP